MLIETTALSKQFGQEYALKNINFAIKAGEIHGLVGENGAGKSTLIKILTGVYSKTLGEILWEGKPVQIHHPMDSRRLGINVIHQDRHLIPAFSGIENIYLGLEYEKGNGLAVNWKRMEQKVRDLMKELSVDVPLDIPAKLLTPPQKTMLEILRAMMTDCKLLILDEPTASLTDKEANVLFQTIGRLQAKGTAVLYVTHRMDEIFQLTDRITIFKNGALVKTLPTKETSIEEIVSLMTDNWESQKLQREHQLGECILSVTHLSTRDHVVQDASLQLYEGEILGIFGLGGSGRTELLEAIYGFRPVKSGKVELQKKEYLKRTPHESILRGMVLISEDRRGKALVNSLSVMENITLSTIDQLRKGLMLDHRKELETSKSSIEALQIKTKNSSQRVSELSGGNQQKVVFAKSMRSNPKIYLCDEPTQAVDVKTREEIHNLLRIQAKNGNGVLFVTSDLKEMLEVADKILILREGKTTVLLENEQLNSAEVLSYCYVN